jgi:hypothetical protein
VLACVIERESQSGDQILHGPGDQDFGGSGERTHARADVHCAAADLVIDRFHLAGVQARADLLRVLTSPSNVRADIVRQFHERGDAGMVEVLTELEADPLLRLAAIQELRNGDGG